MGIELEIVEKKDHISGVILIYGQPKIGKSTLCSSLVDATIDCEDGLKHHVGRQRYKVSNLKDLREAVVTAHKDGMRRISIDTIDEVNLWFEEEACKELGINEMGEGSYGNDWATSRKKVLAFVKAIQGMFDLVFLVGHQKLSTVESETLKSRHVDLPGKLSRFLAAKVDSIGFCEIVDDVRVVTFQPYSDVDAGSRIDALQGSIEFHKDVQANVKVFASLFGDKEKTLAKKT